MGEQPKLAIIAGAGAMPLKLAAAAQAQGRAVHILGLRGEALPDIEGYEHTWMKWGEVGLLFKTLDRYHCREVCIIGSVNRPEMKNIRLDLGAVKNLPFLLGLMSGGDDSVLSRIVNFFENKGYIIRGAHQIAPEFLATEGLMTKKSPNQQDKSDIELGIEVVRSLGALDVGQAAVVAKNYVLAVEAAEGTDAMLKRCAGLRQWWKKGRKAGVLVKCPKPAQEARIDMPTIGSKTIISAAEAGLNGIAVAAKGVLLADREDLIKVAESKGLFVIGVSLDKERAAL